MLSVFHAISGSHLRAVRQVVVQGLVERFVFDFESDRLVVRADEDDDTVDLGITHPSDRGDPNEIDVSRSDDWQNFIGTQFGWGWITVNQQGYCDGILLSFEGIVPQLLLNVMASSVKVAKITRFLD